jgi:hypothetical protein
MEGASKRHYCSVMVKISNYVSEFLAPVSAFSA